MAKISTFGGVTDVRASGLLPGKAGDQLPDKVVTRADGTSEVVNGEVEDGDAPETTPDRPAVDPSEANGGDPPPDPDPVDGEGDAPGSDSGESDNSGESDKRDNDEGDYDLPFDPGPLTVSEVKLKLNGLTDEGRDAVLAAERAGKNRAGILG